MKTISIYKIDVSIVLISYHSLQCEQSSCRTNSNPVSARCEPLGSFFLTVRGTLKGYDQLMNLVLDNVHEVMRGKMISFLPPLFHIVQASIQVTSHLFSSNIYKALFYFKKIKKSKVILL